MKISDEKIVYRLPPFSLPWLPTWVCEFYIYITFLIKKRFKYTNGFRQVCQIKFIYFSPSDFFVASGFWIESNRSLLKIFFLDFIIS